jgi:hypothetical protein
MRFSVFSPIVLALLLTACHTPVAPSDPSVVTITGTVQFVPLEGGFWAVHGDDNVTYDPLGGLPAAFQSYGLRVRIEARRRSDIGSVHMVGPIVEILAIGRLP